MPNDTVPAAATGLPASRRQLLAGFAALPMLSAPAVAIGRYPDAELLALAPVLLPLLADYTAKWKRLDALGDEALVQAGPRPWGATYGEPVSQAELDAYAAWSERYDRARDTKGCNALFDAAELVERRILSLVEPIRGVPAITLQGIALKVRLGVVDETFSDEAHADLLAIPVLTTDIRGGA